MVAAEHGQLGLVHYLIEKVAAIEAEDEVCGLNVMIIDV
jgi:hypothetical protein